MARQAKKKKSPAKAGKKKIKNIKKPAKNLKKSASKPVKAAAKALKPEARATKKLNPSVGVGSPVPDFIMQATRIGNVGREALKGKPFVLYFYPKDDTSGCTAEA